MCVGTEKILQPGGRPASYAGPGTVLTGDLTLLSPPTCAATNTCVCLTSSCATVQCVQVCRQTAGGVGYTYVAVLPT